MTDLFIGTVDDDCGDESVDLSEIKRTLGLHTKSIESNGVNIELHSKSIKGLEESTRKLAENVTDNGIIIEMQKRSIEELKKSPLNKAIVDALTFKVRKEFDWLFFNQQVRYDASLLINPNYPESLDVLPRDVENSSL